MLELFLFACAFGLVFAVLLMVLWIALMGDDLEGY